VPVDGGLTFSSLTTAADGETTCGVTTVGTPYCWGRNEFGSAGSGGTTSELVPALVSGAPAMVSIDPSAYTTCGLAASGEAVCWGWSGNGVLGTGSSQYILEPVRVQ
jgi:alpha-tubulin suppressor-like RCC1 family protein